MSDTRTAPETVPAAPPPPGLGRRVGAAFLRLREASILAVAIILVVYFYVNRPDFLDVGNLVTVSHYVAPIAILAVGEVFLLISGEIDLSVGWTYTFAPFVMYFAVEDYGFPPVLGIVVALLVSALVGFINGTVTVRLGVPAFVTTLGMLFALEGITLITSGSFPKEIPASAAGTLQTVLGQQDWSEIIWAGVIVAIFYLVLTRMRWGLYTFAVGGNLLGATESGIKVSRVKIGNFMICSTLGGITGILEAFRIDSIDPAAGGETVMFYAVAAAVIGGTALAGGVGTVLGAFLGAVVLGILEDGFNLLGISANTYYLILGIAVLVAMIANVYLARLRRTGRI
ncbi:MAG TPA: ABC transporter permease [Streptosporangiaceae bacterium]